MTTSNENAKVTLADLFTAICFVAPVAGGVVEGLKGGVVGVLVGIALGFVFGVLCALGFRVYCISIVDRACCAAESSSVVWQGMTTVLFLILELAWVVGGSALAQLIIRFVVHRVAA